MRRCYRCGQEKPLDLFVKDARRPLGRGYICRACNSARAVAYDKADPEWRRVRRRRSYQKDPAARLAANHQWRTATRRRPAWYDEREVVRIYRTAAWLRALGLPIHVDHTVPLRARGACGIHVQHNLRLAFARENLSKGARHWPAHNGPVLGQFLPVDLRGQSRWRYPLTST